MEAPKLTYHVLLLTHCLHDEQHLSVWWLGGAVGEELCAYILRTGIKAPQVMPGGPTPRYHLSQPGLGWEVDGTAPELTESPTAMQGFYGYALPLQPCRRPLIWSLHAHQAGVPSAMHCLLH